MADPQSPRLTLVVDDSCGNRYEGRDVLGNFVLINVRGRGNWKIEAIRLSLWWHFFSFSWTNLNKTGCCCWTRKNAFYSYKVLMFRKNCRHKNRPRLNNRSQITIKWEHSPQTGLKLSHLKTTWSNRREIHRAEGGLSTSRYRDHLDCGRNRAQRCLPRLFCNVR